MDQGPQRIAFHSPCTLQHGMRIRGQVEEILLAIGHSLLPVADTHLCCGSVRHVLGPAAGAVRRSSRRTSCARSRRRGRTSSSPPTSAASRISNREPKRRCGTGSSSSTRACSRRARSGMSRNERRSPRPYARRLPALPRHPDALDGQRHLRPREQRDVLLVLRHGGERAPDQRRRPRHPQGARSWASSSRPRAGSIGRCRFPRRSTPACASRKLGTSSVTYEIALFQRGRGHAGGGRDASSTCGSTASRSAPAEIPPRIRAALQPLVVDA